MLVKNTLLRLVVLSALWAAPCQAGQQELVWSQSDGLRHEIYHSSSQDGVWAAPEKLTNDNANKLHPAFAIAPDSSRWIFWSAVNPDSISISYIVGQDGKWSEPVKLEMQDLSSAIAPSVMIDKTGVVWLVWAGNNGGQDEIYWTRYAHSVWQKPQLINKANQVPDIRPEMGQNAQGKIEVRWEGFRDGHYVPLLSTYTEGSWSLEEEFVQEEEEQEVKPILPEFVPKDSQYVLLDMPAVGKEANAK
jgi:hypothetical protein